MALDGGDDGLIFYRALFRVAKQWLADDGFCLFEIGYDQGDSLRALAAENGFSCEIKKDLGGCDRVAILYPHHIQ
jgi:release factor glutamine methyltransferase